jgi:hypothetical protein
VPTQSAEIKKHPQKTISLYPLRDFNASSASISQTDAATPKIVKNGKSTTITTEVPRFGSSPCIASDKEPESGALYISRLFVNHVICLFSALRGESYNPQYRLNLRAC